MSHATNENVPVDELECNALPTNADQRRVHAEQQKRKREIWEDSKPASGLDWEKGGK